MLKARCAMNECPVKITIQRQVNESGEPINNRTVLFQGDVYHIVGDIQARRITYDEKEKIRPEFTVDFKLKPSNLYQKKNILVLRTNHLLVEIDQMQVDHLRVSKIYHQKIPYHAILLSPL